MARLGVLTTEFRGSTDEVFAAVAEHGFDTVQLQLGSVLSSPPTSVPTTDALLRGLDVLGAHLDLALAERASAALRGHGLQIAAVDGTYNMAHPDPAHRQRNLDHLLRLIELAPVFGTRLVTLCTGTRAEIMWEWHPGSSGQDAWDDVLAQLRVAAAAAERAGVRLAFEPEHNNVVDTAARARAMIEQVGSDVLGVVMDPANLFHVGDLARQEAHLVEAFALLGEFIELAHAKDLDHDGDAGGRAAGCGLLDYRVVLRELAASGFDGAIVFHQLSELRADEDKNAPSATGAGTDRIGEAVDHLRGLAPAGYLS